MQECLEWLSRTARNTDVVLFVTVLLLVVLFRAKPLTPYVRYNFELTFSWAAMTVFAAYVARVVNLWAGLFLILATWGVVSNQATAYSERAQFFILYGVIWYWFCVRLIRENGPVLVLNVLCGLTLTHLAFLVCQALNYNPIGSIALRPQWTSVPFDPVPNIGLLTNHNEASALLAFGAPAFVRKGWWPFLPLVLAGLALPTTFSGPLAVACSAFVGLFLFPLRWRTRLVSVAGGFLAIFTYARFVDMPDVTWRLRAWKMAIVDLLPERLFTGAGTGHWKIVFARRDVADYLTGGNGELLLQAHNEYVQSLFELGILFAVILIGYTVHNVLRYNARARLSTLAVIVIAVVCAAYHPFHIALLAMVALMWMAMLEVNLEEAV